MNSSRLRTTIWYSGLFLALELLLGVLIYVYMLNSLYDRLDRALLEQSTTIKKILTEKGSRFESFKPDSLFKAPDELVWNIIYDAVTLSSRNTFIQIEFNDHIIYRSDNLGINTLHLTPNPQDGTELKDYTDVEISLHNMRAAVSRFDKFDLFIAFPIDNISATLVYLKKIYFYLFPLFFIIAILGGALISNAALSRIDAIIQRTDEITAHNLDQRIEGEEYKDEYGRLAKQLNSMIARIRNSFDTLNRFSISASHELRTPLTILRGEIELALKAPSTEAELRATLQSNYEETLRLTRIVENIFYTSKLDRALIEFKMQSAPLNPFIRTVIASVQVLGKEKEMKITAELGGDVIVEFDDNQMRQAFFKIIDNAIKYGYEGTNIIVRTQILPAEERIVITFENRGDGIEQQELEQIFEPFYRTRIVREKNIEGVGLGLAVVKSIVGSHRGDVYAESLQDGTTIFVISLPYQHLILA